jgi:hypothetical protein
VIGNNQEGKYKKQSRIIHIVLQLPLSPCIGFWTMYNLLADVRNNLSQTHTDIISQLYNGDNVITSKCTASMKTHMRCSLRESL